MCTKWVAAAAIYYYLISACAAQDYSKTVQDIIAILTGKEVELRSSLCGDVKPSDIVLTAYTNDGRTTFSASNCKRFQPPLTYVIHGYLQTSDWGWVVQAAPDILKKHGGTVVTVDWSAYATADYGTAYCYTPEVGRYITSLLADCYPSDSTQRIIGFSLGAQMAGIIGRTFAQRTNTSISRITGLEPAGPGYYTKRCSASSCSFRCKEGVACLNKNDAEFVDAYHTNAGVFGTPVASGHVDVFTDICGVLQCQCPPLPRVQDIIGSIQNFTGNVLEQVFCHHAMATKYFLDTLANNSTLYFGAKSCDCCANFQTGRCNSNAPILIGDDISRTARGNYYLVITPICEALLGEIQALTSFIAQKVDMCRIWGSPV